MSGPAVTWDTLTEAEDGPARAEAEAWATLYRRKRELEAAYAAELSALSRQRDEVSCALADVLEHRFAVADDPDAQALDVALGLLEQVANDRETSKLWGDILGPDGWLEAWEDGDEDEDAAEVRP